MLESKGCLSRVTGAEIGAASMALPRPDAKSPPITTIESDSVMLGRVRLTFELQEVNEHRRAKHFFWRAIHAEQISPLQANDVKDDVLNRWLLWVELQEDLLEIPSLDTAVQQFFIALYTGNPKLIHALTPDPLSIIKQWVTEDALP